MRVNEREKTLTFVSVDIAYVGDPSFYTINIFRIMLLTFLIRGHPSRPAAHENDKTKKIIFV